MKKFLKNYFLIIIAIFLFSFIFKKESVEMVFLTNIEEVNILSYNGLKNFSSNLENLETNEEITNKKLVNINTATKEELISLPNIGEKIAQNIINYRQENGNFKSIEEIKNVSRIGEKIYEKIKDYITIGG